MKLRGGTGGAGPYGPTNDGTERTTRAGRAARSRRARTAWDGTAEICAGRAGNQTQRSGTAHMAKRSGRCPAGAVTFRWSGQRGAGGSRWATVGAMGSDSGGWGWGRGGRRGEGPGGRFSRPKKWRKRPPKESLKTKFLKNQSLKKIQKTEVLRGL